MELLTSQRLNAAIPYALPEELVAIRRLSDRLTQDQQIVMIGAGPAVFALAMLEKRSQESLPALSIIDIDRVDFAEKHLFAAGCSFSKIYLKVLDSVLASALFNQETVDLLLVDGDHSYEGVRRDIDAWVPKLRPDGKIFFHDYLERDGGFNSSLPWKKGGCAKAVDETPRLHIIAKIGISVVCELLPELS
jgi:predicted O-methyltransferase YrrM